VRELREEIGLVAGRVSLRAVVSDEREGRLAGFAPSQSGGRGSTNNAARAMPGLKRAVCRPTDGVRIFFSRSLNYAAGTTAGPVLFDIFRSGSAKNRQKS
jgi:hypothetical protein